MRRTFLALAALYVMASPSTIKAAEPTGCVDLKKPHAAATLTGVLRAERLAGPPNYESISNGDAEENAFILELPARICADDGEFIDGSTSFDRVQVSSSVPALLKDLSAAVGRRVTVHGEAFGAHTGHHHAPLVIVADQLIVR
jgi:hypothetical protein